MKTTLVFTAMLLSSVSLCVGQRNCGTMEVYASQIIRDSLFRNNRRIIGQRDEVFKLNSANKRMAPLNLTIPVVVHVVFNTPAQRISKAQVESQIRVLNNDFNGTNTDIALVPEPFKASVASGLGVQFELATRDPNGKPTDGIRYIQTQTAGFDSNNDIKFKALGGADAWPRDQYLNVWVGNLKDQLLGYAQFPGGPAATDGVVITFTAFGTTGSAQAPFDKGRTLTHETGHYLGLFHIWGDENACAGSDEMDDTPNQAGANIKCPQFPKVSCNNGPHGDLFVNYMDYVDDKCMVMFTNDQAVRMQSTLLNVRNSLFISTGRLDPKLLMNKVTEKLFLSY